MTRASTLGPEAGQAGSKSSFVCCVFVMQIAFHPVAQWWKTKKENNSVNKTFIYTYLTFHKLTFIKKLRAIEVLFWF